MEMLKSIYSRFVEGFQITDCVVREKNIFYFVLREDYTKWPKWDGGEPPSDGELKVRVVDYFRDEPVDAQWGCTNLNGFVAVVAGVSKFPKEQFVGIARSGEVYVLGNGDDEIEIKLPSWKVGGVNRGSIDRSRTIGGRLYIAGGGRTVGYRAAKNDWVSLTQGLPFDYDKEWDSAGFSDIDGFAVDDIYCVGGKGDVWHFDGIKWEKLPFPSNLYLYTVCCAGDGQVYISGYGGTTFKGRGDKWKKIYQGEMSIPFKDMVWYEEKVWCTSDYGLWTIEDDKLKPAEVDAEILGASGYLSTADGILLLGGYGGAAYKENGKWHRIF
jgi:hypothetical protein